VIRDPGVWRDVLERVAASLSDRQAAMMDLMVSPLLGADGNVEFLAHLIAHAPGPGPEIDIDAAVAAATARQGG
jgi:predicted rRNA methylase YqxC with S4 and FtsJ domains